MDFSGDWRRDLIVKWFKTAIWLDLMLKHFVNSRPCKDVGTFCHPRHMSLISTGLKIGYSKKELQMCVPKLFCGFFFFSLLEMCVCSTWSEKEKRHQSSDTMAAISNVWDIPHVHSLWLKFETVSKFFCFFFYFFKSTFGFVFNSLNG